MNMAEYGFGLVLTGNEIVKFVNQVDAKEDRGLDGDPEILVEDLGDLYNVRFYGDCEEDKRFRSLKNKVDLEYEDMLAFWAKKQPDAIKAVYDGIDEVVEEFKSRIGEFLPEGFNYEEHIGYFKCVIFC